MDYEILTQDQIEIQNLKSQLTNLNAAVDLNRRQLEQTLIFLAQQQTLLEQATQALNSQAMIIARMDQTQTNIHSRVADMEINLDRTEETVQENLQLVQNIPTELQEIKAAISNIRIYQSVER